MKRITKAHESCAVLKHVLRGGEELMALTTSIAPGDIEVPENIILILIKCKNWKIINIFFFKSWHLSKYRHILKLIIFNEKITYTILSIKKLKTNTEDNISRYNKKALSILCFNLETGSQ